jgi:small subunit ribosomal protein S17
MMAEETTPERDAELSDAAERAEEAEEEMAAVIAEVDPETLSAEGPDNAPADAAAEAPAEPAPAATSTPTDGRPNRRKVREGLVVSNAMDKTAVVAIIERVRHPRYAKTVQRTKRLYAHDEENELRVGDRVRLAETRPQSKLKRWRVVQILERAK